MAGAALWTSSSVTRRGTESARGIELFHSLSDRAGDDQADGAVLMELSQAGRHTRLAFLKEGLSTAASASRIRLREHGLMVALSRVDREEAARLFEEALLPKIRSSGAPEALGASFTLMRRWDVSETLDTSSSALLTEELGARIAKEQDAATISALADGAAMLAIGPSAARFAGILADRLLDEEDWRRQRTLSGALEQLPRSTPVGSAAAKALVERLAGESDAPRAEVWLTAIQALADGFEPAAKPELAHTLALRIAGAPDEMLPPLAAALGAFGESVAVGDANLVANILLDKIRGASGPEAASVLAAGLGSLSGRASPSAFESAADSLVVRIEATRDPYLLSLLTSGLHAVATPLRRQAAARLASRLSLRVAAASDPAVLVRLLMALHAVSDGWSAEDAGRFAAQMTARLGTANGAATRRILAFGLHAVDPEAAARILAEEPEAGPPETVSAEGCNPGVDVRAVAERLLNPLCGEENWLRLVVALADLTGEPLARVPESNSEPSLEELAGLDDDDGAAASAKDPIEVDFNRLSDVLSGLRPSREEAGKGIPPPALALLLTGAALLAWAAMTARRGSF